jgi:hypothetical protein
MAPEPLAVARSSIPSAVYAYSIRRIGLRTFVVIRRDPPIRRVRRGRVLDRQDHPIEPVVLVRRPRAVGMNDEALTPGLILAVSRPTSFTYIG